MENNEKDPPDWPRAIRWFALMPIAAAIVIEAPAQMHLLWQLLGIVLSLTSLCFIAAALYEKKKPVVDPVKPDDPFNLL